MTTTTNPTREHSLSPMSRRVVEMSPTRVSPIATDSKGDYITVRGSTMASASLTPATQNALAPHSKKVIGGYDPNSTRTQ
jgi:hypothetical protein